MPRPNLASVAAVIALGVLTFGASAAPADQDSVVAGDGGSAHVVNGVTTGFHPAVGALLVGDADDGRSWCSGTLIGCQTFITAAHCVCPIDGRACAGAESLSDPSRFTVFFQYAGFVPVDEVVVHPDYQFPHADIAILKLAQPVAGLRPIAINATASPAVDTPGTIVGFGSSGGGRGDFGIMRSGRVTVAEGMVGQGDGLLGWQFRGPMGDPGSNANTCSGDSGGPLLLDTPDGWVLAGTTTGGQNGSCLTDDVSIDTDVFAYREWISAVAGTDLSTAACGSALPVDDESMDRLALDGSLDEDRSAAVHPFRVGPAVTVLRVSMNGIDDGNADFDLEVLAPDGTVECRRSNPSQFAVCEVASPIAGTWEIQVVRIAGAGPYQLSVTAIQGEAPYACSPSPRAACIPSGSLHQSLLTWPTRDLRQPDFTWRWTNVQRGTAIDYGDPTRGTDYAFCVYDDHGRLLLDTPLRAGSGWSSYRRGFAYQAGAAHGGAVSQARLRTVTRSRVAILIRGRGLNPRARVSRSNRNMAVQAQLQGELGCWETRQVLAQRPRVP